MIAIYYHKTNGKPDEWASRLDNTFSKYRLIIEDEPTEPRLTEGDKRIESIAGIDAYLDNLEQLVKGWYEDRCDRYEFDVDEGHGH